MIYLHVYFPCYNDWLNVFSFFLFLFSQCISGISSTWFLAAEWLTRGESICKPQEPAGLHSLMLPAPLAVFAPRCQGGFQLLTPELRWGGRWAQVHAALCWQNTEHSCSGHGSGPTSSLNLPLGQLHAASEGQDSQLSRRYQDLECGKGEEALHGMLAKIHLSSCLVEVPQGCCSKPPASLVYQATFIHSRGLRKKKPLGKLKKNS